MQTISPELIGEKIKEERTKQGLTQEELGARLYMNASCISRKESGKAIENLHTLVQIANALDIDVRLLVETGFVDSYRRAKDFEKNIVI